MVGGGIITEIIQITPNRWWVNCSAIKDKKRVEEAIYLDPAGQPIRVGDVLWWENQVVFWSTSRHIVPNNVQLDKISIAGVPRPQQSGDEHG